MVTLTRILAAGGLLAALTVTASAKVERAVEKTFQVQPGVRLTVSTFGGQIKVVTSDDPVVKVVAKEHIRADSDAEADALLQKLELVIEQRGDEVVATAKYPSEMGFHFGSWPPVQVEFVITAPKRASVNLRTSGGDIGVGDLDGTVDARTSGGEIELGKIGGTIDASTSGGNMRIDEGRGEVKLSTSGGNISAGRVAGPTELKTSGGDIRIDEVDDTLTAKTSGGSVRAVFKGALKGDCTLSTSGGEVKATVGTGVGFHLDASTSGGEVSAGGLTITIDSGGPGKSHLSGSVNGGGPTLRLHSSGGDIVIASRKDA
jgi:hypothetical protein